MPRFNLKIPASYISPISGFLLILHSIAAMLFALYVFMSGYKELGPWLFNFLLIGLPWLVAFQCYFKKKYIWTCLIAVLFIAYVGQTSFLEWAEAHHTAP